VTIVTPKDVGRMRAYTRVDFLGSILRKTAFDIMLEDTGKSLIGSYDDALVDIESTYLDVNVTRVDPGGYRTSDYFDNILDSLLVKFLAGKKISPDIVRLSGSFGGKAGSLSKGLLNAGRKVIYRPQKPLVEGKLYGYEERFKVKVKIFIEPDGKVKKAEPVNTTGFLEIDSTAVKFVKGWIFEPKEDGSGEDQMQEVEVILISEGLGL